MNYIILHNELATDPLSRGYSAMSDAEAATDLNTIYCTRTVERLDQADVYNAVVSSEFTALSTDQKREVWDIVQVGGVGGLWVRPGDTARTRFISIFGVESDTISALAALLTEDISRAAELGLGIVKPGHVAKARAL